MARLEIITPSCSPQSIPEIKTREPRFVVCEMLEAIESGEAEEWDDTDWQDFLSYHADLGVRP